MRQANWNEFKNFVASHSLNIQGYEVEDSYKLFAKDDFIILYCCLYKNATDQTEIEDFEQNFKGNWNKKLEKKDTEGNALYRNIIAKENALFHPRVFDFTTGKYGSLCNKNSEGEDLGDAEILFFDSSRNLLKKDAEETDEQFQTRLDSNCKFTWLYFTPTVDYGIKSFEIGYVGTPSGEFDAWFELAPHIPKASGGSIPAMDGGLPLDMFPEKTLKIIDGAACALISVEETYLSHRMGVKIEHEIGDKLAIMSIFNVYY